MVCAQTFNAGAEGMLDVTPLMRTSLLCLGVLALILRTCCLAGQKQGCCLLPEEQQLLPEENAGPVRVRQLLNPSRGMFYKSNYV